MVKARDEAGETPVPPGREGGRVPGTQRIRGKEGQDGVGEGRKAMWPMVEGVWGQEQESILKAMGSQEDF